MEFPSAKRAGELLKRRSRIRLTEKEAKLLQALQTPVTLSIKERPLAEVMAGFEKQKGILINLDRAALETAGVTENSPVSVRAQGRSLHWVLKQMLGDIGLTFIIRNGELRVTIPELASKEWVTRVYYVTDLAEGVGFRIDPETSQVQRVQDIAALLNRIQSIDPTSWESGGGNGRVLFDPVRMAIIVRNSTEMHFVLQGRLQEAQPAIPVAETQPRPLEASVRFNCGHNSRRAGPLRRLFRR
jgi:hypothetical protein